MSQKLHYCGLLGLTLADLLRKTSSPLYERQQSRRRVYYTHKGRCGLGLLCRHWKLKVGDEILMPAYNCGSEIDPFLAHSLNVVFYRVDLQAKIDIDDIQRRITRQTKAVYVTHYFGWPQDIRILSEFCRINNIYLIEDCALSLYSCPVDNPIGLLGDAAIYNFPKSLPVPDGGVLTVSQDVPFTQPTQQSPQQGVIIREMLPLFKRSLLRLSDRMGLYTYLPRWLVRTRNRNPANSMSPMGLPEIPRSYYYDKTIENQTASAITRYIVRGARPQTITDRRRRNYSILYKGLRKTENVQPLCEAISEDVCPLFFPVVVENRELVCSRLNDKGISAMSWWSGFHKNFNWNDFPEAKYLKEHLLAIPIHQQISSRNVDYILSVLNTSFYTLNSR